MKIIIRQEQTSIPCDILITRELFKNGKRYHTKKKSDGVAGSPRFSTRNKNRQEADQKRYNKPHIAFSCTKWAHRSSHTNVREIRVDLTQNGLWINADLRRDATKKSSKVQLSFRSGLFLPSYLVLQPSCFDRKILKACSLQLFGLQACWSQSASPFLCNALFSPRYSPILSNIFTRTFLKLDCCATKASACMRGFQII